MGRFEYKGHFDFAGRIAGEVGRACLDRKDDSLRLRDIWMVAPVYVGALVCSVPVLEWNFDVGAYVVK